MDCRPVCAAERSTHLSRKANVNAVTQLCAKIPTHTDT